MEDIKYNVIFSRRRSISIIVRPDKSVTVRAPFRTPLNTINKFVLSKSSWIKKHLNNEPGIRLANTNRKYTSGEDFLYLGKEYKLTIIQSEENFIRLREDEIQAGLKDVNDTDKVKCLISEWFYNKAREVITNEFLRITDKYSHYVFRPSALAIRPLKSRWGSCSPKGKITINSELIKLNPVILDYVIIHELCHLKYHNHGPDFHKLLGELVPDYKILRKELRKYLIK